MVRGLRRLAEGQGSSGRCSCACVHTAWWMVRCLPSLFFALSVMFLRLLPKFSDGNNQHNATPCVEITNATPTACSHHTLRINESVSHFFQLKLRLLPPPGSASQLLHRSLSFSATSARFSTRSASSSTLSASCAACSPTG